MDQEQPTLEGLRAVLSEWESIQKAKGYERYMQYATDQIKRRDGDLHQPECEHVDFLRGECAGISLFSNMPEIEIVRLKEEIEIRIEELRQEEDDDENELGPRDTDDFTA